MAKLGYNHSHSINSLNRQTPILIINQGGIATPPIIQNKMYKIPEYSKTHMLGNKPTEGETIEQKVFRLIQNKEPIKDGAPIIYTDRNKGVDPAHNIRTDRWEIATDAMTLVLKSKTAKRDELVKISEQEKSEKEAKLIKGDFGKPESIHGKAQNESNK